MPKQGTIKTTSYWPVRFTPKVQRLVEREMKAVAGRNWKTQHGLRTRIILQAVTSGLKKHLKKRDLP